jgi:hypothetical protein
MKEIYQNAEVVLVWLGKETVFKEESYGTLKALEEGFEAISLIDEPLRRMNGNLSKFKDSSMIPNGGLLETLPASPGWNGVMDLISNRSYFTRL